MLREEWAHRTYGWASEQHREAMQIGGNCILEKGHGENHKFDTDEEETHA
jgi:hypothetical protein